MSAGPRAVAPVGLAVGGLISMAAAVGIGRFIYTPILPSMVTDLGLSQADAGLIAAANFVGYLIGALAAAYRSLPGSPRAWLITSLAVSAGTTAAMAVASTLPLLLALRFAGGLASAFVLVFASSLVLERLAAMGRGGLSSVHFAGVGTGIATSAVIAWAAVAHGFDWRWMWGAGGIVSLIGLVAVWLLVPGDTVRRAGTGKITGNAASLRSPEFSRLTFAYGLFGFGYIITATFIVAIVRESPATVDIEPLVWLVVGLAGAPSIALWNWVANRTSTLTAFTIACLVEAVGVAASVLSTSPGAILLAAVLLGGTFMGITALGLIAARRMAADAPRQAVAIPTAAFGVGQIVGPLVAGFGHEWTGSFFAPSMIAVFALISAAALSGSIRKAALSKA